MRNVVLGVRVSPVDYFAVLGLPARLALDPAELQSRFYELSRKLHPDINADADALDASAALNDAYRTLRDPVSRAQHLLQREGFDIGEQRSSNVPPELLEEVFELNMALEELRGGDESVRPQLEEALRKFVGMREEADRKLEEKFTEYDQSQNQKVLEEIRGILNRRKYILNLERDVKMASF